MKKTIILLMILSVSTLSFAQRRDRPHRHYDDNECICDSLRRTSSEFRDRRRSEDFGRNGGRPCRYDSAFNKADVDKKLNETDFGEFAPLQNPENNQANPAPSDSTNAPGSSDLNFEGDSSDMAFGAFTEFSNEDFNGTGHSGPKNLPWIIAALGATILAGVFVRYRKTRKLKNVFLLSSLVIFGFYLGGCPCPISGIQHVILAGVGAEKSWQSMIWFLGLIPITYLFGKVWCGWICHLGSLQEIIFRPGKLNFLKTEKATKILKWTRITLLVVLVVQVLITKTNLFREIDPFKAVFNLYPANTITWILMILLLISSVFIYRPFCRTICPVGLVLGWISKIPGASILSAKEECGSCKLCLKNCESRAITKPDSLVKIDNEECIRCGDCLENCVRDRLEFTRKPIKSMKAA